MNTSHLTTSPEEVVEELQGVFLYEASPDAVVQVQTFDEAEIMSDHPGLLLTMGNGQRFAVTVRELEG